eukprot:3586843-Rhodomonas_salina.1
MCCVSCRHSTEHMSANSTASAQCCTAGASCQPSSTDEGDLVAAHAVLVPHIALTEHVHHTLSQHRISHNTTRPDSAVNASVVSIPNIAKHRTFCQCRTLLRLNTVEGHVDGPREESLMPVLGAA